MTAVSAPARSAVGTDRKLLIAIAVVCLLGIADAGYLTYIHYAGLHPVCGLGGNCEKVQTSAYSKLAGLPVSLLGLLGYIGILLSLAVPGELGRAGGFGIALIGFGFSMYLTYRELFTIKAICPWCVASAVFMTLLLLLTGARFLRAGPQT